MILRQKSSSLFAVFCAVIALAFLTHAANARADGKDEPPSSEHPPVSTWEQLKKAGWTLTRPPYPYGAKARQEQGSGEVELTTDSTGRVTKARMRKAIGHPELDDFVVKWALANWQGPPDSHAVLPVTFRLQ